MNVYSRKQSPILQREGSVILENVSPDGEELPGTVGRLLIPGKIQTKISDSSFCTSISSLQDFLCTVIVYIEDIYFFEVNTIYISSSAVKKISIFHECEARVKMLIFSLHEMKYFWYLPRKSKFSFYFILNGNTEITTLLFTWSFLVRFDFCSVFIGYNIGWKLCLHLENGLESCFNE